MSRIPFGCPEANSPQTPVINLAEGVHFESRENYKQLLEVLEQQLSKLDIISPDLLVAGYDARHDDGLSTQERETTWATPLVEMRKAVENPFANHPFIYAGLKVAANGCEPTIAVYDPSKLQAFYGDSLIGRKYAPVSGQSLASAKLVEFPISYVDESIGRS